MQDYTIKVSGSILSADFLYLEKDIKAIELAGIDSIHLDVMDNHFVPNLSFGPPIIKPLRALTTLPLDTHLMIDSPWLYFDDYINLGVNEICFHIESYDKHIPKHENIKTSSRVATDVRYDDIQRDINHLRKNGVKPGITLNPNTDINMLTPILEGIDYVLVMSVHPGFSGQSFIEKTIDRVKALRQQFTGDIKVDGGVNNTNSTALIQAGATTLITASYLFKSANYNDSIDQLRI